MHEEAAKANGMYPEKTLSVTASSPSFQLLARSGVPVGAHRTVGLSIQMVPYQVMGILQEEVLNREGAAPCSQGWGASKVIGKEVRVQGC